MICFSPKAKSLNLDSGAGGREKIAFFQSDTSALVAEYLMGTGVCVWGGSWGPFDLPFLV